MQYTANYNYYSISRNHTSSLMFRESLFFFIIPLCFWEINPWLSTSHVNLAYFSTEPLSKIYKKQLRQYSVVGPIICRQRNKKPLPLPKIHIHLFLGTIYLFYCLANLTSNTSVSSHVALSKERLPLCILLATFYWLQFWITEKQIRLQ